MAHLMHTVPQLINHCCMQKQVLLLICTCLGFLFTTFPARSACLCAIAITAFALRNHILAACNHLGQQTITATLYTVRYVRFLPAVLITVNSALAAAASRAKRIMAFKHKWTGFLIILRRSAAGSLKAVGALVLSVIKVSKQFASCDRQEEMHLPYNDSILCSFVIVESTYYLLCLCVMSPLCAAF